MARTVHNDWNTRNGHRVQVVDVDGQIMGMIFSANGTPVSVNICDTVEEAFNTVSATHPNPATHTVALAMNDRGDFQLHRNGCQDADNQDHWVVSTGNTIEQVAADWFDENIEDGIMTLEEAVAEIRVIGCVNR